MDAAGSARLDGFGVSAARRLEFGHVGHWYAPRDSDISTSDSSRTVAVEIDPGDGSSLVVFVHAPNRREVPSDFHPDDAVCLGVPDEVAALYEAAQMKHDPANVANTSIPALTSSAKPIRTVDKK